MFVENILITVINHSVSVYKIIGGGVYNTFNINLCTLNFYPIDISLYSIITCAYNEAVMCMCR